MSDDGLIMWTVYDHPADFPDCFVARRWRVTADGPQAMSQVITSGDLDLLRREMAGMGLTVLNRSPDDDPKIVEVWL